MQKKNHRLSKLLLAILALAIIWSMYYVYSLVIIGGNQVRDLTIVIVLSAVIIIGLIITLRGKKPKEISNTAVVLMQGELITFISNPADNKTSEEDGIVFPGYTASEDIVLMIREADATSEIKVIVLVVDCTGGMTVAAEEVMDALKRTSKPTVALIRGHGVSAGYYAATGADIIFAHKNSNVGSIGVTASYLDKHKKNQKEGLSYNHLAQGKYKDMADVNKELTEDEEAIIMRDLKTLHDDFIVTVAANRNLDINKVRELADGSSMLGEAARHYGLVDKIGGVYEAEEFLTKKLSEKIEIIW
jgi:protease-4